MAKQVKEVYEEGVKEIDASKITIGNLKNVTYSGKAFTPVPDISYTGKKLVNGTDYTIAYKNNVNAGTAEAVITFKGDYKGSVTKKFTILKANQEIKVLDIKKTMGAKAFTLSAKLTKGNGKLSYVSSKSKIAAVNNSGKVTIKKPGEAAITVKAAATQNYNEATKKVKVTLKSVKSNAKKKATVKWKKQSDVSGYEIQYSTSSKFKSVKKVTVNKKGATSKTISKLSRGKKYYVRVRAFTKSGKNKITGAYSKSKRVTIKK